MLTLLAGVIVGQAAATAPRDYSAEWKEVANAISTRYYAREKRKEELEKRLATYAPLASAAKTDDEFEQTVNKMIAEFGDSHFEYFTPKQQGYYLMQNLLTGIGRKENAEMPNIGAWFKPAKGGYTVQMLLNGGPAEQGMIRKGDLITAVDGKPVEPVASFADKSQAAISVNRKGMVFIVDVAVQKGTGAGMFVKATTDSPKVYEVNGKKIGYFRLWTMTFNAFRDPLLDAMEGPLKDTGAMILDIRDGFGGRPEGFGDPFFPEDKKVPWLTSTAGRRPKFRYDKPLVVLINGGSRSAKEVFAYSIKKAGRATLIGSNTAGHVLGTSPLRLNDHAIIEIPIVPVLIDGVDLERKGVAPDIAVDTEYDANGKDLYIERALAELTKAPALAGSRR